jgi:phage-related holin
LIFTIFVVFADMATGIMAARKEQQKVNSKGLYRTTEKIVVYFVSILIFEGAKKNLFNSRANYLHGCYDDCGD